MDVDIKRCGWVLSGGMRQCQKSIPDSSRACPEHEVLWAQLDRTKKARSAYAQQWRLDHPDEVYSSFSWTCPLCKQVVQGMMDRNQATRLDESRQGDGLATARVLHQVDHGSEWEAYDFAGQEDK